MSVFKKVFSVLAAIITMLTSLGPATFAPVDAQTVRLNFSVIADTHIDEVWNDGGRTAILTKGLKDMAKAEIRSDALVMAGDLTEKGTANEYLKLGSLLRLYAKTDNLLPQMGNHDIRGIKDENGNSILTYPYSAGKYFELLDKAAGMRPETIYFYKIIKDCYFIVLNPEGMEGMATVLSPAQLQWFDDTLTQAVSAGNPVFIVNHQPLNSVGEQAGELKAILRKYDGVLDIFFLCGHYHDGFSASSITNEGTVYTVNTPAFGKSNSGDYPQTGTGFHVELYDNQIIFRCRDFAAGKWLSEYDRTISLMNSD